MSLGSSRSAMIFEFVSETAVLCTAAGALACLGSPVILNGVVSLVLATLPPELSERMRIAPLDLDWRVFVTILIVALFAAFACSALPAIQATRVNAVDAMHGRIARRMEHKALRTTLIATQTLASAGLVLLTVTLLRATPESLGDDDAAIVRRTLVVSVPDGNYGEREVNAILSAPTVEKIAAASTSPIGPFELANVESLPQPSDSARFRSTAVELQRVSGEYFDIIGVKILAGRQFSMAEGGTDAAVAVVSTSVGARLWPGEPAIVGKTIRVKAQFDRPQGETATSSEQGSEWRTFSIVGVASGAPGWADNPRAGAGVYVPGGAAERTWIVQAAEDPERVRQLLADRFDRAGVSSYDVQTLRALTSVKNYVLSVAIWATGGLAAVAIVLTAVGLNSVLSYIVQQRRRDIGVRVALGASPATVTALIASEVLKPVSVGIGGAVVLTVATVSLLAGLGFPLDVPQMGIKGLAIYGLAIGAVFVIAIASCALPTYRASRLSPTITLAQQ